MERVSFYYLTNHLQMTCSKKIVIIFPRNLFIFFLASFGSPLYMYFLSAFFRNLIERFGAICHAHYFWNLILLAFETRRKKINKHTHTSSIFPW